MLLYRTCNKIISAFNANPIYLMMKKYSEYEHKVKCSGMYFIFSSIYSICFVIK